MRYDLHLLIFRPLDEIDLPNFCRISTLRILPAFVSLPEDSIAYISAQWSIWKFERGGGARGGYISGVHFQKCSKFSINFVHIKYKYNFFSPPRGDGHWAGASPSGPPPKYVPVNSENGVMWREFATVRVSSVLAVVSERKAKFLDDYLKSYNNLCNLFAHVAENEKKRNHNRPTVVKLRTIDDFLC